MTQLWGGQQDTWGQLSQNDRNKYRNLHHAWQNIVDVSDQKRSEERLLHDAVHDRALAPLDLRVALVEAVPFRAASQPSYDDRTLALSASTCRILEGLGLWSAIAASASLYSCVAVTLRISAEYASRAAASSATIASTASLQRRRSPESVGRNTTPAANSPG